MKRFIAVAAVSLSLGLFAAGASASEKSHPHWSYEGPTGPAHWGHVSDEYAACMKGQNQSPIDISGASDEDLKDIEFKYAPSKLNIVNNGHTIQVNYDKGSSIKVNGSDYQLVQFHFHGPSEHTVGGKSFGMELHLVHKNDKGELAVVGVLLDEGSKDNAAYNVVLNNMPKKANEKKELKATVKAEALLPRDRTYYTYPGSLTTPPCTEGVTWLVLKTPVALSKGQFARMNALYKGNNRPAQPLNTRKVTADKASSK